MENEIEEVIERVIATYNLCRKHEFEKALNGIDLIKDKYSITLNHPLFHMIQFYDCLYQVSAGSISSQKKVDADKIIQSLGGIPNTDDYFPHAQFLISLILQKQKQNIEDVVAPLEKISKGSKLFPAAQVRMANILPNLYINKLDDNEEGLLKISDEISQINHSDNYSEYVGAKLNNLIIKILLGCKESPSLLIGSLINFIGKLLLILEEQAVILDLLFVDRNEFESEVAHYTNANVAHLLLGTKIISGKHCQPTKFRLGSIRSMNDPFEGKALSKYLTVYDTEDGLTSSENREVFVGCYTFNHDWLNQFRLYGKSNQVETSGISLIIGTDYFKAVNPYHVRENFAPIQEKVNGLPLYRCIYMDPDSGFVKISRRNEWTFYREYGDKAEDLWNDYQEIIERKESRIRDALTQIKKAIVNINQILDEHDEFSSEFKEITDHTIKEMLLLINYLTKHIAFQEEQECRIVHITLSNSEDINLEYNGEMQRMWIEIEAIKSYVTKIYLGTEASKHKHAFQLAKPNIKNKIRESSCPFRIPT